MEEVGPQIKMLSAKAKEKLRQEGFENYKDYSTAGYEYFEYKTKYNYEDNMHLVIDKEVKKIAHYQLIPFHPTIGVQYEDLYFFDVYQFADLIKAEIISNLGVVSSISIGTGVGTTIGGIGTGVGTSSTTSQQMVNSLVVTLFFKNGETASCNFLNNKSVPMGSTYYSEALLQAKQLLAICEQIIKDNNLKEEPKKNNSSIDEIKKYKELLDQGIITQEEFNKKKEELLNL